MSGSTKTTAGMRSGPAPERVEGTREDCEGLWRALRAMGYMPSDMEIRRVPEHDDPSLGHEACYVRIWGKELTLTPPAGPETQPAPAGAAADESAELAERMDGLLRELTDRPIRPGDDPDWQRSRGELLAATLATLEDGRARGGRARLEALREALGAADLIDENDELDARMQTRLMETRDRWRALAAAGHASPR